MIEEGDTVRLKVDVGALFEVVNVIHHPTSMGKTQRHCVLRLLAGTYFVRRIERNAVQLTKCNEMETLAWATKLGAIESDYF